MRVMVEDVAGHVEPREPSRSPRKRLHRRTPIDGELVQGRNLAGAFETAPRDGVRCSPMQVAQW